MAKSATSGGVPASVDETVELLSSGNYVAGRDLATVVFLALAMGRPLLLEGEAGVGKTEVAKVLASVLDRDLLRLQCFEGLDLASAAYEWDYPRQMMAIRLAEAEGQTEGLAGRLYQSDYLIERPLLRALRPSARGAPVLLIDEIDRADEPFEAFLLEILSDFQLSVPELGTVTAAERPIVVVTSNRTRDVHDALRRRCLYHWLDYPSAAIEREIVQLKAPGVGARLQDQVVAFVQALRGRDLFKAPGVAETIDWANALSALGTVELSSTVIEQTLGALLKYQDDIARVRGQDVTDLLAELGGQQ